MKNRVIRIAGKKGTGHRPARPDSAKQFLLKMLVMAAMDEDMPLQNKLAVHFAGWRHDPDTSALIENAAVFDDAVADLKRKVGNG